MNEVLRDVRFTIRAFRRAPTVPFTVVVSLGVGIGMAIAVLTVFHAVLLRSLPVRDPASLVLPRALDVRGTDLPFLPEELKQFANATRTLREIAGEAHQGAFEWALLDGDQPVVLRAAWVTGNFFDVLGARPALGRFFTSQDESLQDPSTIVLSYDTWRRLFARDSAILGHRFTNPYGGHVYTVVGVAPAGLDYPAGVEYWSPKIYGGGLDVIGRMSPGATPGAVVSEFLGLADRTFQGPGRHPAGVRVQRITEGVVGNVRPGLLALLAAVLLSLAPQVSTPATSSCYGSPLADMRLRSDVRLAPAHLT